MDIDELLKTVIYTHKEVSEVLVKMIEHEKNKCTDENCKISEFDEKLILIFSSIGALKQMLEEYIKIKGKKDEKVKSNSRLYT
ncbi:MAG: hypothetical protein ACTSRA_00625 [Promethearchaeota archaeon]|nr:MAG: hypothetical protein [Helarchaeota virus Nidhogg Meg22_1012]URC17462.1 MAG: hypothetical protein [Helarchaeota virus Nidhogg Meg22_1214]